MTFNVQTACNRFDLGSRHSHGWYSLLARIVAALLTASTIAIGSQYPLVTVAAQADQSCFAETNHCIAGRIREFWEQNGGLPVFGFPITPQREEMVECRPIQVQWFERNRLELHPENAAPYDVLLGRLGADRLRQLGYATPGTGPRGYMPDNCLWFPQTGHAICNEAGRGELGIVPIGFKTFWLSHGLNDPALDPFGRSLALFGAPLTWPSIELNPNGDRVWTQWFERARFESHPSGGVRVVLLGLLGDEYLKWPVRFVDGCIEGNADRTACQVAVRVFLAEPQPPVYFVGAAVPLCAEVGGVPRDARDVPEMKVRLNRVVETVRVATVDLKTPPGLNCATWRIAPPTGEEAVIVEMYEVGASGAFGGDIWTTLGSLGYRSAPRP